KRQLTLWPTSVLSTLQDRSSYLIRLISKDLALVFPSPLSILYPCYVWILFSRYFAQVAWRFNITATFLIQKFDEIRFSADMDFMLVETSEGTAQPATNPSNPAAGPEAQSDAVAELRSQLEEKRKAFAEATTSFRSVIAMKNQQIKQLEQANDRMNTTNGEAAKKVLKRSETS
ncbi:hypothetical protein PENTCL1PPCAC_23909, partial [Pristionchus entomophagus]